MRAQVAAEPAEAVARARAAFALWGTTSVAERAAAMHAVRRAVVGQADRIVDVVTSETGKSAADTVMAEVVHAAAHAGWLARALPAALAERRVSARPLYTKVARLAYRPRGVAAVIAPWNYPFLLPFLPAATALAAGCTVVVKPSEITPASGGLLLDVAAAAGLPPDVLQVVGGDGAVGAALVDADVDVVAVTGSTETGRKVAAAAGRRLVPVVAELGGKDPLLVLPGADLRRAARATVWGACFNAGQSCVSVERVYVVASLHDEFVAELERAFAATSAGTGDRTDVGPMIAPHQVEVVLGQVADAVAKGAVLRRGGRRIDAGARTYVEPTLLTGVDHSMTVMREETFGPVVPVMAVADEDAAVAAANDSPYALGASVWTGDPATGRAVAARLRAGAVALDDVAVNYALPQLPFGGSGASGYGRQGGADGILAYCTSQSVTESRWRPRREPHWFPRLGDELAWRRVARLLHGR
jgi:succinate-semialdehyde dehydrogenase/glutarate-semialdehyde dehydrogenase